MNDEHRCLYDDRNLDGASGSKSETKRRPKQTIGKVSCLRLLIIVALAMTIPSVGSEERHDVLQSELVHGLEFVSRERGGGEVAFLLLQLDTNER